MKLFLLSDLAQTCDDACAFIHWVEKRVQALHLWAWKRATAENLRQINTRRVREYSVFR